MALAANQAEQVAHPSLALVALEVQEVHPFLALVALEVQEVHPFLALEA